MVAALNLDRKMPGVTMNARKRTAGRLVVTILSATILCGCDKQNPVESASEAPSAVRTTTPSEERSLFAAASAALEQDGIADWTTVSLTSTQQRWIPTGLQVKTGMPLTILSFGALMLDSLRFEPRNVAWVRVGEDGDLIKLSSNQLTLEPEGSGELYLTIPPLGMYWDTPDGRFPQDMSGLPAYPVDMDFIAVQWSGDPGQSLKRLTKADDDVFSLALQKLNNPKTLPDGFSYLWFLGQSDVFDRFDDGVRSGVHGYAENNWGIIKKEVDLPLTEDAEIEFDWLYTTLPPDGPETEEQYHDYLSVAVEFENGQDITWFWSRFLEVGQGFRCPLYWWDEHETHIVLQSGTEDLGEWYSHKRNILEDYVAHIGGEVPERIVGVWFIATSLSGTPADAKFSNVSLTGTGPEVRVFDSGE
jgi:hypothetical protein